MKKLVFLVLLFVTSLSFGQAIDTSRWIKNDGSFNYNNWKVRNNLIIPTKTDTSNKISGLTQIIGTDLYFVATDHKWKTYISDTSGLHTQLVNQLAAIQANASSITGKQSQLNGTGFVKSSGTSISYDNTSYFPAAGGVLSGTAGNGYVGFPPQATAPTVPSSGFKVFASSAGAFSWLTTQGYMRELRIRNQNQDFIGYFQNKPSYTIGDSADIAAKVDKATTIKINGVTKDLSGNQDWGTYLTSESDPKRLSSIAVTGTTTKTVTATLADASTVTTTFTDATGSGAVANVAINTSTNIDDSIWFSGTSITAGVSGLSSLGNRFSTKVSAKLGALESNNGISGASMWIEGTNATNLAKIPVYSATKYRWMILEWGVNDMQLNVTDTTTYAAAYLNYIDNAISKGWPVNKILVLSPSYVDVAAIPAATAARQSMFQTSTKAVSTRRGTLYLDNYSIELAAGKDVLLSDGIHPNDFGSSVAYTNPITKLLGDSVRAQGQVIAANGLTEIQQLKFKGTDTATYSAVALGLDDAGNVVRFNRAQVIQNSVQFPTGVTQAASISLKGNGYFGNVTSPTAGEKLQVNGTMKASYGRFDGQLVGTYTGSSVEIGMIGSIGLINAYNRTTPGVLPLAINSFGGAVYYGAGSATGTNKHQFTGTSGFGSSIYVGGFVAPTANLHLKAGSNTVSTAPLKFSSGVLATTAASGTGSVVTLTFASQLVTPYPSGSTITVSGTTPSGYNGTFVVTSGSTTQVTYASTATGAQTVAGTISPTLLTTPEPGAVEYDGTNLFITPSTGSRQAMVSGIVVTGTGGVNKYLQTTIGTTVYYIPLNTTLPN